jgi:hypothetical protein
MSFYGRRDDTAASGGEADHAILVNFHCALSVRRMPCCQRRANRELEWCNHINPSSHRRRIAALAGLILARRYCSCVAAARLNDESRGGHAWPDTPGTPRPARPQPGSTDATLNCPRARPPGAAWSYARTSTAIVECCCTPQTLTLSSGTCSACSFYSDQVVVVMPGRYSVYPTAPSTSATSSRSPRTSSPA